MKYPEYVGKWVIELDGEVCSNDVFAAEDYDTFEWSVNQFAGGDFPDYEVRAFNPAGNELTVTFIPARMELTEKE